MDSLLPRSTWLRLLHGDNGVSAASDAMRQYLDDHVDVVTPVEALHALWRLHCGAPNTGDPDTAALLLLLVAVARLERQFASTLLLSDPLDVAGDLKVFAGVAGQWHAAGALPSAWKAVCIQLLHVAAIHLRSSATRSAEKERLQIVHRVLRAHGVEVSSGPVDEDRLEEEAMDWKEFEELSSGLEQSALLRTKNGRHAAQLLIEASTQHQSKPLLHEHTSGPRMTDTAEMVWEAASILMECCEPQAECNSSEDIRPTHSNYEILVDEDGLLHHVRSSSGDASPLSPSRPVGHVEEELAVKELFTTTTTTADPSSEDELIQNQVSALEAIRDHSALCIRVTSLLGLQLQRGATLAASVSSTRSSQWEQAIRKAVNSLTSADRSHYDTRQLLVLTALHPNAAIEIILSSAVTSSQHHEFFIRLLLECPLLARWTEPTQQHGLLVEEDYVLTATLSRVMRRLVCEADASSPVENSAAFRFILRLSTPPLDHSTLASDAVVAPDSVLRFIFWPVLKRLQDSATSTHISRLFTLIDHFLEHVHGLKRGRLSSRTLHRTLEFAITTYTDHATCFDDNTEHQNLRDRLLVATRSLLRASVVTPDAVLPLTSELLASIDVRMQCLLASDNVFPSDFATFAFGDEISTGEFHQISDALLQSIEWSLWWLVWARDETHIKSHLAYLYQVHEQEFVDCNLVAVNGASVAQNQIAEMLLSSGGRVFDEIVRLISEFIVPLVRKTTTLEPNPTTQSTVEEVEENVDSNSNPQQVMEYVLRCWSVVACAPHQPNGQSVVRMLNNVVSLVDQAIEAAHTDATLLLRCLQAAGLLYSWLRTKLQDAVDTRTSNRVEVTATRVMFLLKQHEFVEEASTRSAVATVLVSTGLLESDSVMSFLRSVT